MFDNVSWYRTLNCEMDQPGDLLRVSALRLATLSFISRQIFSGGFNLLHYICIDISLLTQHAHKEVIWNINKSHNFSSGKCTGTSTRAWGRTVYFCHEASVWAERKATGAFFSQGLLGQGFHSLCKVNLEILNILTAKLNFKRTFRT